MKAALSKENPTTNDGMKKVVKRIWSSLIPAYLLNLYSSMPRRMAAVIASNGGATKY